uniref:Wsv503 n=1 Tax=White spot syndrome virus TaxID=92652 RepID=A0A2U9GCV7_WSSV|nr:wsv503 [Shrimp white spot syndrome virus]
MWLVLERVQREQISSISFSLDQVRDVGQKLDGALLVSSCLVTFLGNLVHQIWVSQSLEKGLVGGDAERERRRGGGHVDS